MSAFVGMVGLGVMGKSLALNMADHGYQLAVYDIDAEKVSQCLIQDMSEAGEQRMQSCVSFKDLLDNLQSPRLIVLSIPAGSVVDSVCEALVVAGIQKDDIVVDTGNSLWTDSINREKQYQNQFLFFSSAVSGGELGARFGPSLMPSGNPEAWARLEPLWQAIAAKVDPETGKALESYAIGQPIVEGEPCTTYIGPAGSGHYVKMVHNGIEYADMQLICEAYDLMRIGLGMSCTEISEVFVEWNETELGSYLIEITAEILATEDSLSDQPLVDVILDKAGQKGTGLWTAVSSLELGCPAPTISQAVYSRSLSSLKTMRISAAKLFDQPDYQIDQNSRVEFIERIRQALYCAKVCAYAQGFHLMKIASDEQGWELDFAEIAKIWRAGCIIRAQFLQHITQAYQQQSNLEHLLLAPYFQQQLNNQQGAMRQVIAEASLAGIPFAAFGASLTYFDAFRRDVLPTNLLQAQRDYFGAHTFERLGESSGQKYHVEWTTQERLVKPV